MDGAAIYAFDSQLFLSKTTLNHNTATGYGGGILLESGRLTLTQSTLDHNIASIGGALANTDAHATIQNSTLSANQADTNGGGVAQSASGEGNAPVSIFLNSTIANNGNNGFWQDGGQISSTNTIVAQNGSANCVIDEGTFTSVVANLADDATCLGFTSISNIWLDVLRFNGGETATHALLPYSPALNSGDNDTCLLIDQRGELRTSGSCDVGAYELSCPDFPVVVSLEKELNEAFLCYGMQTGGLHTISFSADIALVTDTIPITNSSGTTLLLQGGGYTLDGANLARLLYKQSSTLELYNLTLKNGITHHRGGGAIYNEADPLHLYTMTLQNNHALTVTYGGGAILSHAPLSVTASTFGNNGATAAHGGGALYVTAETTLFNSLFISNTAAQVTAGGGAIYAQHNTLILSNTLQANHAISATGGAIHYAPTLTDTSMVIQGALFNENRADNGGAVYNQNGRIEMGHSAILSNTAVSSGGGLYGLTASYQVTNSTIAHNTAQILRGGGLYLREGAYVDLRNTTISGNHAAGLAGTAADAGNGGGIYIGGSPSSTLTLNNVTLTANRAAGNGGGLDFNRLGSQDLLTVTNTIVAGNYDADGYPDCYDNNTTGYTLVLNGHNLFGGYQTDSCTARLGETDLSLLTLGQTITDVLLSLGDYGGAIIGSSLTDTLSLPTHDLLEYSPAVDTGHDPTCEIVDAREVLRPRRWGWPWNKGM